MQIQKTYSLQEALQRMKTACDKRERTHWEVREKLIKWALGTKDREDVIATLISDNYLNEERYAIAFANDKSRFFSWGPKKIMVMLRLKGISEINIANALKQLDGQSTQALMKELYEKQKRKWPKIPERQMKLKMARFLIGKGYESSEVWSLLNNPE
ncbi:MAG: regulatory protein RecX [Flavobacteriales bacterium]|nr:regulatory protein RecX [Flavobacteriales bacterium]